MKALNIEMPDEIYAAAEKAAALEKLSPEQFLSIKLAQTIARTIPDPALEEMARRGRAAGNTGMGRFLARVPKVEPEDYDKL